MVSRGLFRLPNLMLLTMLLNLLVKSLTSMPMNLLKKEQKKMDLFIQYALAASDMALADSGFKITEENAERVGVVVGSGLGGLPTIEHYHSVMLEKGHKRISHFLFRC